MDGVLNNIRSQREQMLAYMQTHMKAHGRMPVDSYCLVHAFVEVLEAIQNQAPTSLLLKRWEAVANKMLDIQLFGDSPNTVAVSISNPAYVEGVDGCTLKLSEMISNQREVLLDALGGAGMRAHAPSAEAAGL